MKKILALFMIFILLLSGCGNEKIGTDYDFSNVMEKTMEHIMTETPNPNHDSVGGEWAVIVAVRYGADVPSEWLKIYYNNLCDFVKNCSGELSKTKHSDYSRTVLALSAIGKNPENVEGYNLLESYSDYEFVTHQGISGAIFALISLDSLGYDIQGEDVSREKLIEYILSEEYENGGWALMGENADVDITSQVIQALAPYYGKNDDVTAAVDRAVELLSKVQKSDGGFYAWESENVQTAAQVVIALCSVGIDIRNDARFIKEDGWIGSYMMQYYLGDGAFCHTLKMGENSMATEQCMQALTALKLFETTRERFFDFKNI